MKKAFLLKPALLAVACICSSALLYAQHIKMITPLGYTTSSTSPYLSYDTSIPRFAVYKGICYFSATTGPAHIRGLWRSDGTTAGTYHVGNLDFVNDIEVIDNKLYAMGTYTIIIDDTAQSSLPRSFDYPSRGSTNLVSFNGLKYFGSDGILVSTDGTDGGTKEVFLGFNNLNNRNAAHLTVAANAIIVNFGVYGNSTAYVSDGSKQGTVPLDISANDRQITALGDSIYFIHGDSLYTNPGSSALGSSLLVGNPSGALLKRGYLNKPLPVLNGDLYFAATTALTGTELYKYSPSQGAISLVKDIVPGSGSGNVDFNSMVKMGNLLYFMAGDSSGNKQLWKSDGTDTGTVWVKTFDAGSNSFSNFTDANGTLFFTYSNSLYGNELWKSDGTDTGTVLVTDINPGIYGSNPAFITPGNGSTVFFTANDGVHGAELFKSDGTDTGTALVKDINTATPVSPNNMQGFTRLNNQLLYSATDDIYGTELWATDGTPAGTAILKDIVPGSASSNPVGFIAANSYACFFTDTTLRQKHHQVWRTDGTAGGTFLLESFNDTLAQPSSAFVAIGDNIYFFVADNVGDHLWRTDGTVAGTVLLKDFAGGYGHPSFIPSPAGSLTYFLVFGNGGNQLWRSDGTTGGTIALSNLSGNSYYFTTAGNLLYFAQKDSVCSTDGTVAGTGVIRIFSDIITNLAALNNRLWFFAGNQLWVMSNGVFKQSDNYSKNSTHAGPSPIVIVNNTAFSYQPYDEYNQDYGYYVDTYYGLAIVDTNAHVGVIYSYGGLDYPFVVSEGKIWTTSNPSQLSIINTSTERVDTIATNLSVSGLADVYGKLYFAEHERNGTGIGYSDGTSQGTQLVSDALLPFNTFGPTPLMPVNKHLVFSGFATAPEQSAQYNPEPSPFIPLLYSLDLPSALPVSLTGFTARLQSGNGLLNWSTATEQNSDYFAVQRSIDGLHFNELGKVTAAGNSSTRQSYNYTDYAVTKLGVDKVYYRLQQFDKDGKFAYSKTIPLTINLQFTASVSPVPVAGQLNVNITALKQQTVAITIVDVNGKVLASTQKAVGIGATTLTFNAQAWAPGSYIVQVIQADGTKQTIKVVK